MISHGNVFFFINNTGDEQRDIAISTMDVGNTYKGL